MNKYIVIIMMAFMLPGMCIAQESKLEKLQREYRSSTIEEKASMDSLYQPVFDKFLKEQVKTICGIPFGISHEKAETMLRNKFGSPDSYSSSTDLYFKNIKYAGHDFAGVHFLFQSDGLNSYLNACIFIIDASSLSDAIEIEKNVADNILSKYTLLEVKDSNGYPTHGGGFSPLWDGRWSTLIYKHITAIHTDIIKYKSDLVKVYGIPYSVRIIYGPFNYVKEEF